MQRVNDEGVSSSAADARERCKPRIAPQGREDGEDGEGGEGGGVAENLFFGKKRSADLCRDVFLRCRSSALAEGYVFVQLRLRCEAKTPILQVVAERNDGTPMTLADCAALSRSLAPVLEGEGLVYHDTRLEVSSPGVERPLTRVKDFRRFAGREVALEIDSARLPQREEEPLPRRFRATLVGVEGDDRIVVEMMSAAVDSSARRSIPVDALAKARLVVSASAYDADKRRG